MKHLLLIPVFLLIAGCSTIENFLQDDIEQIKVCSEVAQDAAQNTFEGCTLLGGEPVDCLIQAKDTAKATFDACLTK